MLEETMEGAPFVFFFFLFLLFLSGSVDRLFVWLGWVGWGWVGVRIAFLFRFFFFLFFVAGGIFLCFLKNGVNGYVLGLGC